MTDNNQENIRKMSKGIYKYVFMAVVGVLALTCGYCGTLLTPMAANFNIVPVALLEMKDRMGVIRNQILPALVMISVQIVYMLIAS